MILIKHFYGSNSSLSKRCCLRPSIYSHCTVVSDNIIVPFAPKYDSKKVESNKYDEWKLAGYFNSSSKDDSEVFSMILPPPNITGTLHLGHALTITLQDILCRWKRMQGYSVVWVPGTDHAGIATQVIVEKNLYRRTGQTRHQIGREKFLQLIDEWKMKKIEKINDQIKQLGASVDWSSYFFTMDPKQSDAVIESVIRMFEDNLLYREETLVNWSCYLGSTISDYEIEYKELEKATKLSVPGYEGLVEFGTIADFNYKVVDSDEEITVSTTRPETIFGDVAVAVHPTDARYSHLRGAHVHNPLIKSPIPIIFDEIADPNFGTGAVKITPGHSKIDFEVAKRHNLPVVTILNETGHLNEACGEFATLSRFAAKEKVLSKLSELGLLKRVADHKMQLPICSRSRDIVEQIVKPQWFIRCGTLTKRAIEAVEKGELIIEPEKHKNSFFKWLDNYQDWCISRQIWWGHQLPLYKTDCGWIAAKSEEDAKIKSRIKLGRDSELLDREKDVLDTWLSSSLLPFSIFGWPQMNKDLKKNYPLSVLETGADILNFWVVRMIILGLYFTEGVPFKRVLLHGMICDSRGKKMSKSLGNVIDFDYIINGITLKELNTIVKSNYQDGLLSASELQYALKFQKELFPKGIAPCGADALRLTMAALESKEQVINFNPSMCQDNTTFCNKMWQASKFIIGWSANLKLSIPVILRPQTLWQKWLLHRLQYTVSLVEEGLEKSDFYVAARILRYFFHRDLCDIYLELAKPVLKHGTREEAEVTCSIMLHCLEVFLRLMCPIMPFVTEELYSYLPINNSKIIWKTAFPCLDEFCMWTNENAEREMNLVKDVVTSARSLIQYLQYRKADAEVVVVSSDNSFLKHCCPIMRTLTRCKSFEFYETNSWEPLGPISTVENEALVYLISNAMTDEQILNNMKLLQTQMNRPRKELNDRLKYSESIEHLNKNLEKLLYEWNKFQSSTEEFFRSTVENSAPQVADLIKAAKLTFDAHELKNQIMKTLPMS